MACLHGLLTECLNTVCNLRMTDGELIEKLGGPAKVCELLAIPKAGGIQRVQNWKSRGIPARVRLQHPEVFATGAHSLAVGTAGALGGLNRREAMADA